MAKKLVLPDQNQAEDVSSQTRASPSVDARKTKMAQTLLPTKLVVRYIPPKITMEVLLEILEPMPETDYMCFVEGDTSMSPVAYSRLYLNCVSSDEIVSFYGRVDGKEVEDEDGTQSKLLVELAWYQKIPKSYKSKKDAKQRTIDDDEDYLSFKEAYESETSNSENQTQSAQLNQEQLLKEIEERKQRREEREKELTPLIQSIVDGKQKREDARKQREEERKRFEEQRAEQRKRRDEERKRQLDLKEKQLKEKREKAAKARSEEASISASGEGSDLANDKSRPKIKFNVGRPSSNTQKYQKSDIVDDAETVGELPEKSKKNDRAKKVSESSNGSDNSAQSDHVKHKDSSLSATTTRLKEKPDIVLYRPGARSGRLKAAETVDEYPSAETKSSEDDSRGRNSEDSTPYSSRSSRSTPYSSSGSVAPGKPRTQRPPRSNNWHDDREFREYGEYDEPEPKSKPASKDKKPAAQKSSKTDVNIADSEQDEDISDRKREEKVDSEESPRDVFRKGEDQKKNVTAPSKSSRGGTRGKGGRGGAYSGWRNEDGWYDEYGYDEYWQEDPRYAYGPRGGYRGGRGRQDYGGYHGGYHGYNNYYDSYYDAPPPRSGGRYPKSKAPAGNFRGNEKPPRYQRQAEESPIAAAAPAQEPVKKAKEDTKPPRYSGKRRAEQNPVPKAE